MSRTTRLSGGGGSTGLPNLSRTAQRKTRAVAIPSDSATSVRADQRRGAGTGAGSAGVAIASSSSIRASAMSWSRRLASFWRQRVNRRRMLSGVAAGNRVHAGSAPTTAAKVSVTVSRANAGEPVSISNSTQPKAQMSVRLSTGWPLACSGLMYAAVPRTTPAIVPSDVMVIDESRPDPSTARAFARPKSSTLTTPSGVILMFEGLRSRWMTPAPWAASSASAICRAMSSASGSRSGPRSTRSCSVSPSTNSSTRADTLPASSNPKMAPMCE